MKNFEMPEIKVMTVSVNERIATSGGTALPEGSIGGFSGHTVFVDGEGRMIGTDIKKNNGQISQNLDYLIAEGCLR